MTKPTSEAVNRIMHDYAEILKEKNPLIHVYLHEDDITLVDVLIIGPQDTPYENGFFHFQAQYPNDYPWSSPKVRIRNTNHGTVHFNPNLYADGTVCLSILGTWRGPGWSAIQTMSSTFISIQSLLNECPFHNEPGYENYSPDEYGPAEYTKCMAYETMRTAVCHTLEHPSWSDETGFNEIAERYFLDKYEFYLNLSEQRSILDGSLIVDELNGEYYDQKYDYASLVARIKKLRQSLLEKYPEYSAEEGTHTPDVFEQEIEATTLENDPSVDEYFYSSTIFKQREEELKAGLSEKMERPDLEIYLSATTEALCVICKKDLAATTTTKCCLCSCLFCETCPEKYAIENQYTCPVCATSQPLVERLSEK